MLAYLGAITAIALIGFVGMGAAGGVSVNGNWPPIVWTGIGTAAVTQVVNIWLFRTKRGDGQIQTLLEATQRDAERARKDAEWYEQENSTLRPRVNALENQLERVEASCHAEIAKLNDDWQARYASLQADYVTVSRRVQQLEARGQP